MTTSLPTGTRDTRATVEEFFARFAAADRSGIRDLFGDTVEFVVDGSADVPWTGRRETTAAVGEFFRIALEDITTERFDIANTIVDGPDAVVLGMFAHRITATGKVFASSFALHIRVRDGRITGYRMYEDSFGAHNAWQQPGSPGDT